MIDDLLRILSILAGFGIAVHFFFMSNFGDRNAPVCLKILSVVNGIFGVWWLGSAIKGDDMTIPAICSACGLILFVLWIWVKGFHVSEFVKKDA